MAWLCAALVLVITSLSAFIRLSRAGQGCEPWPQCQSAAATQEQAGAAQPDPGDGVAMARMSHRVVASTALLLVMAMAGLALGAGTALRAEARLALALVGLALSLAVLGRWSGQSRLPAVTLGNLLGGFAMFAVSVRLALMAGRTDAAGPRPGAWLGVATALAWAQAVLGGLVSAGQAGLSCPALGACDWRAGAWQVFNPWVMPAGDVLPTHSAGALVHLLHRWSGVALALVLLVLAWQAWRLGRRAVAAWLLALPLLLVVLGLVQVWLRLPLPLVLVHNAATALLLGVLMGMGAHRSHAP